MLVILVILVNSTGKRIALPVGKFILPVMLTRRKNTVLMLRKAKILVNKIIVE